jgi:hypothetical protein
MPSLDSATHPLVSKVPYKLYSEKKKKKRKEKKRVPFKHQDNHPFQLNFLEKKKIHEP